MVRRSLAEDSLPLPVVHIKICGTIRAEDALAAVVVGADATGLMLYMKSPRMVDVYRAWGVVHALPPFVTSVGLFVNASRCKLDGILDVVPLDLLQFRSGEHAEDCEGRRRPYLKALRTKPGDGTVGRAAAYPGAAGILLDTYMEGAPGDTGAAFDWLPVPVDLGRPLVLAGDLTPDSVGKAVEQVKPYAVGVSGGAEVSKEVKDVTRVRALMDTVRSWCRGKTWYDDGRPTAVRQRVVVFATTPGRRQGGQTSRDSRSPGIVQITAQAGDGIGRETLRSHGAHRYRRPQR